MRRFLPLALVWCAVLGGCSGGGYSYVPGDDPEFPRLKISESDLTLNDRCPVRKIKLNPAIDPVWVNGRPVGFC